MWSSYSCQMDKAKQTMPTPVYRQVRADYEKQKQVIYY